MSINDPRESDWDNQYDDDSDCFLCGGEGFVWECFDGYCECAEEGCDDCTRECPECVRARKKAAP